MPTPEQGQPAANFPTDTRSPTRSPGYISGEAAAGGIPIYDAVSRMFQPRNTVNSGVARVVATGGATQSLDVKAYPVQKITLTADVVFSFTNVPTGVASVNVILVQDGTGNWTASWPGTIKWTGGAKPTITAAAGSIDVVSLFTPDSGATWYGYRPIADAATSSPS